MCVDVKCAKNLRFCNIITGAKGAQDNHEHLLFWCSHLHTTTLEENTCNMLSRLRSVETRRRLCEPEPHIISSPEALEPGLKFGSLVFWFLQVVSVWNI